MSIRFRIGTIIYAPQVIRGRTDETSSVLVGNRHRHDGQFSICGLYRGEDTIPGGEYLALDNWLSETEVGGADDTYGGSISDRRGNDEIQVEVGVKGNRGNFAFGPSAVAVTPGTTVRWVWTGEGGGHKIVADPEDQIGKSDYMFSSSNLVKEAGHEYVRKLDESGIALYHCGGITGIHEEVTDGPNYKLLPKSTGRSGHRSEWSLVKGSKTATHYEPHLSLGMKGGIAVSE